MCYQVYASGPRKGQPKLQRDRIIRYLIEGKGMIVVDTNPHNTKLGFANTKDRFIFVGKAGSTRIGKSKTNSGDIAYKVRHDMEDWETEKGLSIPA